MVKSPPGEILRRALTSTRAASVAGIAIWLPWGLLRTLYRNCLSENPQPPSEMLATLAVVAFASIGTCIFVRITLLRNTTGYRASAWRTFLSYALILVVAGVVQELPAHIFDSGAGFSFARILTGLFGLYLVASLWDYYDRYQEDLAVLHDEQQKLAAMREASAFNLMSIRSQIVNELKNNVNATWTDVFARLTNYRASDQIQATDFQSVADEIRTELITPVRTLSYNLPEANYSPDAVEESGEPTPTNQNEAVDWHEMWASVPAQHPYHPAPVAVALSIVSLSNTELFNPIEVLVGNAVLLVTSFGLWWLAKILLAPWLSRQTPVVAWVVWVASLFVIGTICTMLAFAPRFSLGVSDPVAIAIGSVLIASFAAIFSTFATIFDKSRMAKESTTRAVKLTLRETNALQQEVDSTKSEVAHVLHGEIQSMLTSAAFRLNLAAENMESDATSSASQTALDEVLIMLSSAADRINSIAYTPMDSMTLEGQLDIQERIKDVCTSWTGIVDIEAEMSDRTANRLNTRVNEASLAPVVTDAVREAILNAVRHGKATHVNIKIESTDSLCRITVMNDGEPPVSGFSPGLGLETLNRLGYEWSLATGQRGGGILSIELPLLRAVPSSF